MKKNIALLFFVIICEKSFLASAQQPLSPTNLEPPPKTSVQIVNATSVPLISLEVNGRMDYPQFPQGQFSSNAPIDGLTYRYKIVNKLDGTFFYPEPITYVSRENQTLLLLGDFSLSDPEGKMPQLVQQTVVEETNQKIPPNLVMRVYSHQKDLEKKPVCIRIINGMPRKMLRFRSPETNSDVLLNPGDEIQLEGQPLVQTYYFLVDATPIQVPMRQEENPLNANIVFYLENKTPKFMRFYQSIDEPSKFN
jgi:hypothetical protein